MKGISIKFHQRLYACLQESSVVGFLPIDSMVSSTNPASAKLHLERTKRVVSSLNFLAFGSLGEVTLGH